MAHALISPRAEARVQRARAWLAGRAAGEEVLVVAASADAASELLRGAAQETPAGACFGWHRVTPGRLAAELARGALVDAGLVPVARLGAEALVAHVVHQRMAVGELGRFAPVAGTPGFARAVAGTIEELRLAGVAGDALDATAPELRALLADYEVALAAAGLADRAQVFALATGVAQGSAAGGGAAAPHPWLGLPLLLLDVAVWNAAEEALLAALLARAPDALATLPAGDAESAQRLARMNLEARELASAPAEGALARVQAFLFEEAAPPEAELSGGVEVLSAPGESRECVELARKLLARAREGIPFDRMAVLLRSPDEYRPHLKEALGRAGIPAHFARGARLPDPAGRAFVALLACAAEGLSARRFAEYLSLGEVPDATPEGAPPAEAPAGERWVAPDEELVPAAVAEALAAAAASGAPDTAEADAPADLDAPVVEGALRAPRRWERLLVDAAVIGGRERWEVRLDGLDRELERDLDERDDPEDPVALGLRRQRADLAALRGYALPLLAELSALPDAAPWSGWLDRLSALATRALRHPERVLATLAELQPMAGVGPVDLSEVRRVLSRRLLEVELPAPKSRHGGVFVAPAEAARGLAFDVVCVPGLAEKLFPREIREEPILLDRAREEIGAGLLTNEGRVSRERLALRLAVGAATRGLLLSYPRLDLEKARPRVPSFYGLEALRAGEGRLPGFGQLAARAETVVAARIGWPAPPDSADAIDEAEHDLALLDSILEREASEARGTARYLLTANPHLGRALRFRARRWIRRWTPADGLVEPGPAAVEALRRHRLDARSYSPTALENYADCPYRFFLQALHRLAPREVPEAIDEMSPLQRGSLVHQVQFELLGSLRKDGLLPVTPDRLADVLARVDAVLDEVAARYREEWAPAIERVWTAGVEDVRADLREWLRRLSTDGRGFVPRHFELAFGLAGPRDRDPASVAEPVPLDCGIALRGSIDLVEGDAEARLRVTDHKTGKVRLGKGGVLGGGAALQPVLYALAAEKLFPDASVTEGRLSYCTSVGGFEVRGVPLDDRARAGAGILAEAVGEALSEGFFPALPRRRACTFCDYRVVCGPYEEQRTARKPARKGAREALERLRELP